MTNHQWVTAADRDNNLVVDVLRKLYDDSPPSPEEQQDPPQTTDLPLTWTVRQPRSRPRAAPRRRPQIAPSVSNPSATSNSVNIAGASSVNAIVGGVDESTGGETAVNDVVSIPKEISTEPERKTTPTKKQKKRKPKQTLKSFMDEHKRRKKALREGKLQNEPVPLAEEPEGMNLVEPEGKKVDVLVELQEMEVVATGEIRGLGMVEDGGTGPETEAVGDHGEDEGRYVLPDLNISIMDDTFM